MKHKYRSKLAKRLISLLLLATIVFACKKEYSFEGGSGGPVILSGNASGALTKANGVCAPIQVNGVYKKDTACNGTNSIAVNVDFTGTGNFVIYSDTIDGFYFRGSGNTTSIGSRLVTLQAFGTPNVAGSKNFTFFFNQSNCLATVPVVNSTVVNNGAEFIFAGAPGACAAPVIGSAPFVAGQPLGINNTVILNVTVTRVGTYTVTTGPVNGMVFSITGVFTNLGANTIFLVGSGTPTAAGVSNFPIASTTTNCNFNITVLPATTTPPASNPDYIPSTTNSNWTSKVAVVGQSTDTAFLQVNANNKTFGANSYRIFEAKEMGTPLDSTFIRKNGSKYYQFIDSDFGLLPMPINKELMILDTLLALNATWTESLGTVIFTGLPVAISVNAKIVAKDASEVVQGISYNNNIIKVTYIYKANVPLTGMLDLATEERWYARGVGIIHSNIENLINPGSVLTETTRYQIN